MTVVECRDLQVPRGERIVIDDLSLVVRAGEWVALVGNTWYSHEVGHGMSVASMSDALGVFGTTSTSQVVQPVD